MPLKIFITRNAVHLSLCSCFHAVLLAQHGHFFCFLYGLSYSCTVFAPVLLFLCQSWCLKFMLFHNGLAVLVAHSFNPRRKTEFGARNKTICAEIFERNNVKTLRDHVAIGKKSHFRIKHHLLAPNAYAVNNRFRQCLLCFSEKAHCATSTNRLC